MSKKKTSSEYIPWFYDKPGEGITPDLKLTVGLSVSSLQVYPLKEPIGKTKAIARVLLNDALQLTGLRVVDGFNGLFVSYPNDPSYKGEDYRSLFYPTTKALRDHIEDVVLNEFLLQPFKHVVTALGLSVSLEDWVVMMDNVRVPRMDIPLLLAKASNLPHLPYISEEDMAPFLMHMQSLM